MKPLGLPKARKAALLKSLSDLQDNTLNSILPSSSAREALRLSLPFLASEGLDLPPILSNLLKPPVRSFKEKEENETTRDKQYEDLMQVALSELPSAPAVSPHVEPSDSNDVDSISEFMLLLRHPSAFRNVTQSNFVRTQPRQASALLAALFTAFSSSSPITTTSMQDYNRFLASLNATKTASSAEFPLSKMSSQVRFYSALLSPNPLERQRTANFSSLSLDFVFF